MSENFKNYKHLKDTNNPILDKPTIDKIDQNLLEGLGGITIIKQTNNDTYKDGIDKNDRNLLEGLGEITIIKQTELPTSKIDRMIHFSNESILTTTDKLLFRYNRNYSDLPDPTSPIIEVKYASVITPPHTFDDILEYEEITSKKELTNSEIVDFKIKETIIDVINDNKNTPEDNSLNQYLDIDMVSLISVFETVLNKFKLLISNSLKYKEPYSILTNHASFLNESIKTFSILDSSPLKDYLGAMIYSKIGDMLKDVDNYQDQESKLISIRREILNNIAPNLINDEFYSHVVTAQNAPIKDIDSLIIDIEENTNTDGIIIDIEKNTEPTNAMPGKTPKDYNKIISTPLNILHKKQIEIGSGDWLITITNKIKEQFIKNPENPYQNLNIFLDDLIDVIENNINKKSPILIKQILIEITSKLKQKLESPISNIIIERLNKSSICIDFGIILPTSGNVDINMHINTDLNSIIAVNTLFDELLGDIYATMKDIDSTIFIPSKYLSKCKNLIILRKLAVKSVDEKLQLNILKHNDPFCERIIASKDFISPKVFNVLKLSKNPYILEKLYSNPNLILKNVLRELVFDSASIKDLADADQNTITLPALGKIKEKHVKIKQSILDLKNKFDNFVNLNKEDELLYAKLKGIARLDGTHPYVLHTLATFNDFRMKDLVSQNTKLNEITASYLIETDDLILQENISLNPSPYLTKKPQNYSESPIEMLINMGIKRFTHFIARRHNLTPEIILNMIHKNPTDEILFILLSNNYNMNFDAINKIINSGKTASLTALANGNVITSKTDRSLGRFHGVKAPIKELLNFSIITSNFQIRKSLKMLNNKKIPIVVETLLNNSLVIQHFTPGPQPTKTGLQKDIKSIINLLIQNNFDDTITNRLPIELMLKHGAIEDKLNIIYSCDISIPALNELIKEKNDIINTAILEITKDTDEIIPNIIKYTKDKKLLKAANLKSIKLHKLNTGKITLRPRNTEQYQKQNFKLLEKFNNKTISYNELIELSLSDNINDLKELALNMDPKHIDAWINILSANYNKVRLIAIKRDDLPKEIYEAIVEAVRYDKILEFASKADHIPQYVKAEALEKLEKARIWNEKRYMRNKSTA